MELTKVHTASFEYGGIELKARSIPHLLQLQAEVRGDAPFIQTWDDALQSTISFAETYRRVTSAADSLQRNYGVAHGDHCAILSHNSTDYLVLSIGIMQCRAVSFHLNWRSPASQLLELVRKSKCTMLFATHHFQEQATAIAAGVEALRVVYVEDMELHKQIDQPFDNSADARDGGGIRCEPSDNAVVFFTSGSTSLPKAVPHTHASLMWLQHEYYRAFPEPYQATDLDAGTLCFFPYFHVSIATANAAGANPHR
jgi:acyl-CoA synthetase (AMP-forming)/AMP-acid ligase II